MTSTHRPELAAYALAIALVAAIATLAGLKVDVPTVLPYTLLAVVGVAGGVSLPLIGRNEPPSAAQSPEQPTPGVIPPASVATPVVPPAPAMQVPATVTPIIPTVAPAPPAAG